MRRRILIVDTVSGFRKQVANELEGMELAVVQAVSDTNAKAIFTRQEFDLIAVAGVLEESAGIDFAAWVRVRSPRARIAMLFDDLPETAAHERLAESLGIDLALHRPILPEDYANELAAYLFDEKLSSPPPQIAVEEESVSGPRHQSRPPRDVTDLKDRYREEIPIIFSRIGTGLVQELEADRLASLEEAHRLAHSLSGTAGTLGFSWASMAGEALEEATARMIEMGRISATAPLYTRQSSSRESGPPRREAPTRRAGGDPGITPEVLVVDDDPVFLEKIEEMGRENLVHVFPARDAEAAIRIAAERSLDCAVLDIYLAEGDDAFEIAERLRLTSGNGTLPIAFISSDTSTATRIAAVHAGGSQFLRKPLSGTEFAAVVRHLVIEGSSDHKSKILVVDDDDDFLEYMEKMLGSPQLDVATSSTAIDIMDRVSELQPDLLLLDVVMPGVDGFDVCRILRASDHWRELPIVFLTARATDDMRLKCFQVGGDDYISKPFTREELLARVQLRLDRCRAQRERADRDPITGLSNRRAFIELMKMRLAEAGRLEQYLSLVMIDIDHFKQVNDTHGHLAGDRVLGRFGRLLGRRFRTHDIRGRWGGEEFVIAFLDESIETARMIVARIQDELRDLWFEGDRGLTFKITFSAGIATFPDDGRTIDDLFKVVDRRLYSAKRRGRDLIVIE